MLNQSIFKQFSHYVRANVLGMVGLSCYILADTYFVAKALGAVGLASLNFAIAIYTLIHATGLMLGMGGAIQYSTLRARGKAQEANKMFMASIIAALVFGIVFFMLGMFASEPISLKLGADISTVAYTSIYLKTIMCFSPFFLLNNVFLAFTRNDNQPNKAMQAMLVGSFSNILLDYLFMFPLGMGMFGAAFATSLAPIISLAVMMPHFLSKNCGFSFLFEWRSVKHIFLVMQLGMSSFINEMSSAIVLITFNLTILQLAGNTGVAAYGVVANIAFVALAIFTGIAQGIQPLISEKYGLGQVKEIKRIVKYGWRTSTLIAGLIYGFAFYYAAGIAEIFNSEGNTLLNDMAVEGIHIYFIGFIFAGLNIILSSYLGAMHHAKEAFWISISRGFIVILPVLFVMSRWFGMLGVWSAFVIAEGTVACIAIAFSVKVTRHLNQYEKLDMKSKIAS